MDQNRPATRALMACLGEPSRFRLVRALVGGARCVTDLAAEVGLSQSCTTRHLQALEHRGVVRGSRDGKRVMYRIRDDRDDLMPLIAWAMEARGMAEREPVGGTARAVASAAARQRASDRGQAGTLAGPDRVGRPAAGPLPGIARQAPPDSEPAQGIDGRGLSVSPAMIARDPEPPLARRRREAEIEDFLL